MDELRKKLTKIPLKKRLYFEYLYPDLRFVSDNEPLTKERLMKRCNVKTLDTFKAWERTEQFQQLKAMYYQQKANVDFYTMYEEVSKKAKEGDEKAVKLFLTLTKELKSMAKAKTSNVVEDDGLVV